MSGPQTSWGLKVLNRLSLTGDERVIDAGCGTGRLTAALLERLPRGRVLAIDRSWNMLLTARANLRPDFGSRVSFAQVALPPMPVNGWADVVFSTATFHWIRDHAALFRHLFTALAPGGRLHAQCGGGPNLARAHALAEEVMALPTFTPFFEDWSGIWEFSDAATAAARLGDAGFVDVETGLEEAFTTLPDEASYREFVTTVIYNPHLSRIPDPHLRARFIDEVAARAGAEPTPWTLDYWRLNLAARRP
ncbi:MAG: methyltransferase domain-containing protein [Vicinamibacterales bacterium]